MRLGYAYVCTNYNNAHFTRDAVASLNAGNVPPALIVVVDNASRREDRALLEEIAAQHPNVELVLNTDNVGYFAGLNSGLARLREREPEIEWSVTGNNDLSFPADFGNRLAEIMVDSAHHPVISPYIETLDGMPQNPHVIAGISRLRELAYDLYYASYPLARLIGLVARLTHRLTDRSDEQQHAQPQHIYQGHGSCYILTPAFFRNFSALWAPTFLMGEEFFLSRQLAEKGFMTYYDPRVRIRHRCNGALENLPPRRMWEFARDAHRVYRRYVKPWQRQDFRVAGIEQGR